MPVKRRKSKIKTGFTEDAYLKYCLDGDYPDCWIDVEPFDADTAKLSWQKYKKIVLDYWLQDRDNFERPTDDTFLWCDPGGAGTRPSGWWDYEAKKKLRKLMCKDIKDLEIKKFGKFIDRTFSGYESEYEYLCRHDLLTSRDKKYFKRFPQIEHDDWVLLYRMGWISKSEILRWQRSNNCLTEKGKRIVKLELAFLKRLGLADYYDTLENG